MPYHADEFDIKQLLKTSEYEPLPENTSEDIKYLVAKLLNKDQDARPSINQILKEPIMQRELKNLIVRLRE